MSEGETDQPSFLVYHEKEENKEICILPKNLCYSALSASLSEMEQFKVFLRIRPNTHGNSTHRLLNQQTIIVEAPPQSVLFKTLPSKKQKFTFTSVLDETATQRDTFEQCVLPPLQSLFSGEDFLIMAYGTTSAGKTFTMHGTSDQPGLIPRVISHLFRSLHGNIENNVAIQPARNWELFQLSRNDQCHELDCKKRILGLDLMKYQKSTDTSNIAYRTFSSEEFESIEFRQMEENGTLIHDSSGVGDGIMYTVWMSMIEIYNEQLVDLLQFPKDRTKLSIGEDKQGGFYVKNAKQIHVKSGHEAFQIAQFGRSNLSRGRTALNDKSSRSHCLLTLTLVGRNETGERTLHRITLCDLAGTERSNKTKNTGKLLVESNAINKSLSVLGNCLKALKENQTGRNQQVIPIRDSNLTKLCKNGLLGTEKLVFIVNLSTDPIIFDETLAVLRFSALAQEVICDAPRNPTRNMSRFSCSMPDLTFAMPAKCEKMSDSDPGLLTSQLSEAQEQINQLDNLCHDLQAKRDEMSTELQEVTKELVEMSQRAEDFRQAYLKSRDEYEDVRFKLYEQITKTITDKNLEKQRAVKELTGNHEKEITTLRKVIHDCKLQEREIKEKYAQQKAECSQMHKETKRLNVLLENAMEDLQELKEANNTLKQTIVELEETNSALTSQNQNLMVISANQCKEKNNLQDSLDAISVELAVVKRQLSSMCATSEEIDKIRESDRERREEAEKEALQLRAAVKESCVQQGQLIADINDLKAALTSCQAEKSAIDSLAAKRQSELADLRVNYDANVKQLEMALESATNKILTAEYQSKAYLAMKEKAEEELHSTIERLEEALTNKEQELSSFESQRNFLINKYEHELAKQKEEIEMLRRDVDFRQAVFMDKLKNSDANDEIKRLKDQIHAQNMKITMLERNDRSPLTNKTNRHIPTANLIELSPFCKLGKDSFLSRSNDDLLLAVFKEPKLITPGRPSAVIQNNDVSCCSPQKCLSEKYGSLSCGNKENMTSLSKSANKQKKSVEKSKSKSHDDLSSFLKPQKPVTPRKLLVKLDNLNTDDSLGKSENQSPMPVLKSARKTRKKVKQSESHITIEKTSKCEEMYENGIKEVGSVSPASGECVVDGHAVSKKERVFASGSSTTSFRQEGIIVTSPKFHLLTPDLLNSRSLALKNEPEGQGEIVANQSPSERLCDESDKDAKVVTSESETLDAKVVTSESETLDKESSPPPPQPCKSARKPRTARKRDPLDHPALSKSTRGRGRRNSESPPPPTLPPRSAKKQLFSLCDAYVELSDDSDFLPQPDTQTQRKLRSRSRKN